MNDPSGVTDILGLGQVGSEAIKAATYFLDKLIGPSLDAVGQGIAAPLTVWKEKRVHRAMSIVTEAAEVVTERGADVQAVPGRILWPTLEYGSLEEDADLHQMWVRLLATAAHPQTSETVLPSFPHILKELAPIEAQMLVYVAKHGEQKSGYLAFDVAAVSEHFDLNHSTVLIHRDNLERLNLLQVPRFPAYADGPPGSPYMGQLYFTKLAYAFILACNRSA